MVKKKKAKKLILRSVQAEIALERKRRLILGRRAEAKRIVSRRRQPRPQFVRRIARGGAGFTSAVAEQQASAAQSRFDNRRNNFTGSRAEQIEIWATSLSEIPMLRADEAQRTRATTPPDAEMIRVEQGAVRSFAADGRFVNDVFNEGVRSQSKKQKLTAKDWDLNLTKGMPD